jgi:hypothetical protein
MRSRWRDNKFVALVSDKCPIGIVIVVERKGLQNWKGVVECLVQLQIFQRPVINEDIVYTVAMLECNK